MTRNDGRKKIGAICVIAPSVLMARHATAHHDGWWWLAGVAAELFVGGLIVFPRRRLR